MSVEEAFHNLRYALIQELGDTDPYIKLGLDHETFTRLIHHLSRKADYRYGISDIADCKLFGIKIVPVDKKEREF